MKAIDPQLKQAREEGFKRWQAMCWDPERPIYELWTQELVSAIASYLVQRARVYGLRPMRVLEAGAGDGKLSHFITKGKRDRVYSCIVRFLNNWLMRTSAVLLLWTVPSTRVWSRLTEFSKPYSV